MSADAQSYVFCRSYAGYVILFLKRIDNPSIPLSKANIQLYFVNGYLGHGKRGKMKGGVRVNVIKRKTSKPLIKFNFYLLSLLTLCVISLYTDG